MDLASQYEEAKVDLQVSSLIDVVFLLLIYFIVSAKIIQPEGDIPFSLPADVPRMEMVVIPVEARIRINKDDSVVINNGMNFPGTDENLEGLITQIKQLKSMASAQRTPFFVTLDPTQETSHKRIVDVMDACAGADVKNLTFSKSVSAE